MAGFSGLFTADNIRFTLGVFLVTVAVVVLSIATAKTRDNQRSSKMSLFLVIVVIATFAGMVLVIMSMRKEIDCPGCMAPGLFVKCKPGTGSESEECKDFQAFKKKMGEFLADVANVGVLASRIGAMVSGNIEDVKDAIAELGRKIDAISVPTINLPSIGNLSLPSCKIPVVNTDLCKGLASAVNASIVSPLRTLVNAAGKAAKEATESIPRVITVPVKEITAQFAKIGEEISGLAADVTSALDSVMAVYENFSAILGSANISNIIVGYLTETISGIFGSASKLVIAFIVAAILMFIVSIISIFIGPAISLLSLAFGN